MRPGTIDFVTWLEGIEDTSGPYSGRPAGSARPASSFLSLSLADLSLRALPEVSYSRLSTPRSDSLPLLDPVNGEVRGILRDLPQANAAAALAPQAGPGSLDMLFSRGIPDVGAWGR